MLKPLAAGLIAAALALMALPAFAADPAKLVDTAAGKIWVNDLGMTLYTFDKDTVPGKSMCNGDCATEWPPLPAAADAVAAGDWTIVVRDDGSKMWAYEGHPLYTFLDDTKAGDVTGDNKDGFKVAM